MCAEVSTCAGYVLVMCWSCAGHVCAEVSTCAGHVLVMCVMFMRGCAMNCHLYYVCTYVRMYVCTYVRMYVCTYVSHYTYVHMYIRMYICTYISIMYMTVA